MGLSADRTMKGMKGGGIVMRSLETQCAVRACPGVRNERGQDQVAAAVDLPRQDQVFQGKEAPPRQCGVRLLGEVSGGENRGCGQCPRFEPRTGPYRCRTGPDPCVSAGAQCFRGLESGSSPTSGTVWSLFRGLWASECAQTDHLLAPSGAFFVGGRCLLSGLALSLSNRSWWGGPLTA